MQVAERGGGAGRLHGADWRPAGRAESSRYPLWVPAQMLTSTRPGSASVCGRSLHQ
jgi:hypothetical protein